MSTNDKDIEAVDAEVRARQETLPAPGWYATAACLLIIEARQERDEARDAQQQLQYEHKGLCEHHMEMCRKASEDMAELRAERDGALGRAEAQPLEECHPRQKVVVQEYRKGGRTAWGQRLDLLTDWESTGRIHEFEIPASIADAGDDPLIPAPPWGSPAPGR